jgi:hypothetical protein
MKHAILGAGAWGSAGDQWPFANPLRISTLVGW